MGDMSKLDWVSFVLLVIGGLNWGLVAAFQWNLVSALLGSVPLLERVVYGLVGLSALWAIYGAFAKR